LEREVVALEGQRELGDRRIEDAERLLQELLPRLVPFHDDDRPRLHEIEYGTGVRAPEGRYAVASAPVREARCATARSLAPTSASPRSASASGPSAPAGGARRTTTRRCGSCTPRSTAASRSSTQPTPTARGAARPSSPRRSPAGATAS